MIVNRKRSWFLGDDAPTDDIPSSDILFKADPTLPPLVPTPYGTGETPVTRPLTEDEIAQQYGGNPVIATPKKAPASNTLLLAATAGGVLLLAIMMSRHR